MCFLGSLHQAQEFHVGLDSGIDLEAPSHFSAATRCIQVFLVHCKQPVQNQAQLRN